VRGVRQHVSLYGAARCSVIARSGDCIRRPAIHRQTNAQRHESQFEIMGVSSIKAVQKSAEQQRANGNINEQLGHHAVL
jgi:hypothetical protein